MRNANCDRRSSCQKNNFPPRALKVKWCTFLRSPFFGDPHSYLIGNPMIFIGDLDFCWRLQISIRDPAVIIFETPDGEPQVSV